MKTQEELPNYTKHIFVAGNWKDGSGPAIKNINPWNQEELFTLPSATTDDVNEAFEQAAIAQKKWAAVLPPEKSRMMQKLAEVVRNRKKEFAEWARKEVGATLAKGYFEAELVASVFESTVHLPLLVEGKILPRDIEGKESLAVRQPLGVIGLISPWNFPGQLTARTLGPALAVGNAVVLKPASTSIVTGGLIFASFLEEAGFPKGLLSVLPGGGSTIGTAITKHPISKLISFTGSTPVGREVGKNAIDADIIKNVELELGGNSPFVVLEDADIDQAVEAAAWGKFMNQGQICMAINRIIVEDKVYDEFTEKFITKVKGLKRLDMNDPDTFIGPIIDQNQFDTVKGLIDDAKEQGYKMALGGEAEGLHMPPHIFVDVDENCPLFKNEIFGPAVSIARAKDTDDALRLANATDYGLSSSVFTQDEAKGMTFAKGIEAGMTHINDQPVNDSAYAPFGGVKNSGLGRFNGQWGVKSFTSAHWITIQKTPRKYPFKASDFE
ncbi:MULTISPECIES: aldehyde dehydrogenase family protein [unclassified Cellulophaga]|uniref:aldehyde dehydrogenase family protein n=1 Tax=unclassified Cellulophaga TaxID=2634405 RepID=UPI0026E40984|nr:MULTISPECIES: aldehyde dehydrogenase family protein [unclassified Cellulophaga]MDO6489950.1 aldehyde dehydrogenase family protein [Cellulophaga sp. 2_MG-2023]MDO6494856.1 aldehyde dehydrogenase family protein [Cellulophaga sp. 3_MG-2023]